MSENCHHHLYSFPTCNTASSCDTLNLSQSRREQQTNGRKAHGEAMPSLYPSGKQWSSLKVSKTHILDQLMKLFHEVTIVYDLRHRHAVASQGSLPRAHLVGQVNLSELFKISHHRCCLRCGTLCLPFYCWQILLDFLLPLSQDGHPKWWKVCDWDYGKYFDSFSTMIF